MTAKAVAVVNDNHEPLFILVTREELSRYTIESTPVVVGGAEVEGDRVSFPISYTARLVREP